MCGNVVNITYLSATLTDALARRYDVLNYLQRQSHHRATNCSIVSTTTRQRDRASSVENLSTAVQLYKKIPFEEANNLNVTERNQNCLYFIGNVSLLMGSSKYVPVLHRFPNIFAFLLLNFVCIFIYLSCYHIFTMK